MKISEISFDHDKKFIDVGPVTAEQELDHYQGNGFIYYKIAIGEPRKDRDDDLWTIVVSTHLQSKYNELVSYIKNKQKLMLTNVEYKLKFHSLTMRYDSKILLMEGS